MSKIFKSKNKQKKVAKPEKLKELKLNKEYSVYDRIVHFFMPKTKMDDLVINMELINGRHKRFVINGTKNTFKFKNGTYIVDESFKYFSVTTKTFELDYHQCFALPIKREWNLTDLKDSIIASKTMKGEQHLITAVNPQTLNTFIDSKVIEGVMRGQQLQEFIQRWNIAFLILIALAVIHLLVYLTQSGALKGIF